MEVQTEEIAEKIYRVPILSLNENVNGKQESFRKGYSGGTGDELQIMVEASSLEPHMM